jgi:photosystem II stability/assembly factor-like uncharacterized protein
MAVFGGLALCTAAPAVFAFRDPVNTPAAVQPAVGASMLAGVARAGSRVVAVGARGVIALSANEGRTWEQVPSPVSSDLVAVQFVDADHGWATGHDGVVLGSRDGGRSWKKLTDGRQVIEQMKAGYAPRVAQGDAAAVAAVKLLEANSGSGGDLPWLSLWFSDQRSGFVVGPFGMIAATDDGGATWQSWVDRIDNPDGLHLNAIREIGGELYIAAEKGMVFKLHRARGRFVRLSTGYEGTFFGVMGDSLRVLAFGLRGTCFQSVDGGASWERVATGLSNGIAAGALLPDRRMVLAGQGGQLAVSDGGPFIALQSASLPFTDILPLSSNRLLMVGLGGATVVSLSPAPKL